MSATIGLIDELISKGWLIVPPKVIMQEFFWETLQRAWLSLWEEFG